MSFHFALNKFNEKLSAPTSEQAGPWISTFPAGLLGLWGIFPRLLGGFFFFFGLCAWTHMTEQLTWRSQPPSNRAENSGQKRSWQRARMHVRRDSAPMHMRPLVSSRYPGMQMHLKLPSSLMHSPLRQMFLIRHSSWSVDAWKQFVKAATASL